MEKSELVQLLTWLVKIHDEKLEIMEKLKQYRRDCSGLKGVQYDRPHVSGGKFSDLSNIVIHQEEEISRLIDKWGRYDKIDIWRSDLVHSLCNLLIGGDVKGISLAFFVNCKTADQIANQYKLSCRHVMWLRGRALSMLIREHGEQVTEIVNQWREDSGIDTGGGVKKYRARL